MLQVPDFADSRWRSALFHIMRDQLDLTVRRQNRQCSARIGVLNGETDMEPDGPQTTTFGGTTPVTRMSDNVRISR